MVAEMVAQTDGQTLGITIKKSKTLVDRSQQQLVVIHKISTTSQYEDINR